MIIDNGWKSLAIITKHSILDVAAAIDPPLELSGALKNIAYAVTHLLLSSAENTRKSHFLTL